MGVAPALSFVLRPFHRGPKRRNPDFAADVEESMANASHGGNTAAIVWNLCEPVAAKLDLDLWDVRFLKEGASWYLRIFIDKEGGVSLDDCEAFSRAIDPVLDEATRLRNPIVWRFRPRALNGS